MIEDEGKTEITVKSKQSYSPSICHALQQQPTPRTNKQMDNWKKFSIASILSDKISQQKNVSEVKQRSNDANRAPKTTQSVAMLSARLNDGNLPSYTAMIGQAILSSNDKTLTLSEIYEFIEQRYPGIEQRVRGWRNCVRHNLSLHECFIKLGPSVYGRGNDWTIHPSYMDNFRRGNYRKRMLSKVKISNCCNTAQDGLQRNASMFSLAFKRYMDNRIDGRQATSSHTDQSHKNEGNHCPNDQMTTMPIIQPHVASSTGLSTLKSTDRAENKVDINPFTKNKYSAIQIKQCKSFLLEDNFETVQKNSHPEQLQEINGARNQMQVNWITTGSKTVAKETIEQTNHHQIKSSKARCHDNMLNDHNINEVYTCVGHLSNTSASFHETGNINARDNQRSSYEFPKLSNLIRQNFLHIPAHLSHSYRRDEQFRSPVTYF